VTAAVFARRPRWSIRPVVSALVGAVVVVALWEGYRAVGPTDHVGTVLGFKIVPRANDTSMPHVIDMLRELGKPEVRGSSRTVLDAVAAATWYSFRIAVAGLALGAFIGMAFAVLMSRFAFVRRGLIPYLVVSQTVPLIALAPLTVNWGGQLKLGGLEWQKWMSSMLLGAFLAFFPIAIGALRGLTSPAPESLELLDSYAASWWQGLVKLRLPAATPYLLPALRLAGGAAVLGVVVSEISIGLEAGIGRLILSYGQEATSRPAKPFAAVFGAIALGIAMAVLIAAIGHQLTRNRPVEVDA
jgi:NitT/TauT family transport system permease protein